MITLDNISKTFNEQKVLEHLSLKIREGDVIHISGINGSGKSTILKIIAGLLQSDSGTVKKDEHVKIGALIENPSFILNYTAKENLDILFKLVSKNSFSEKNLARLFKTFDLDYYDERPVSKYSLGMLQKLGIIQAVMEDQNLIIFDEPSRGIDDTGLLAFSSLVNALSEAGKAVVIASHDLDNLTEIKFTKKFRIEDYELKSI